MPTVFWNNCYFTTFLTILFYQAQSHFGKEIEFSSEWSSIQHLFVSTDGLFPENQMEEAEARSALYGSHGDILYTEDSPTLYGAAVKDEGYRWPGFPGNCTVPYVIDETLESITDKIEMAMEQYHNLTCIRFVEWTDEEDYIYIYKGKGCSSFVGRQGGKQLVTLGKGCEFVGTIVHELGHAIGLYHEHQRTDRDDYINVYINNVQKGQESNFEMTVASDELKLTDFNLFSIMIYGEYAFSSDPDNLKTMEAKNKSVHLQDPYQKPGMDNTDIRQVNKLYECEIG